MTNKYHTKTQKSRFIFTFFCFAFLRNQNVAKGLRIFLGSSGIGNNIAHKSVPDALSLSSPVAGRSHMALFCNEEGYVKRFSQFESASGSGHVTAVDDYQDGMFLIGYNKRGSLAFPVQGGVAEIHTPAGCITQSYVARLNAEGGVQWVRWLKPLDQNGHVISQENDICVAAYGSIHALALLRGKASIGAPGQEGEPVDGVMTHDQFRLFSFSAEGDLLRAITIGKDRPIIIKSIAPFDDGKGLYISGYFSKSARVNDELGNHRSFKATGKTQRVLIRYRLDDQNKGLFSWF